MKLRWPTRVQLIYEETPGLGAKRFRALLDENPKNDVARYGLAIAQIKGGQATIIDSAPRSFAGPGF